MTRPYRYITRQRADTICPRCAEPKTRQAVRCKRCYADDRRAGLYPDPPRSPGRMPDPANAHKRKHRATGRSSSRPQPQSHPWRKTNGLLKPRLEDAA